MGPSSMMRCWKHGAVHCQNNTQNREKETHKDKVLKLVLKLFAINIDDEELAFDSLMNGLRLCDIET